MLRTLYVANATLLVVHEIDSAFWREWELFRLPGGEAGFLLAHLALVPLVLWGLERVTSGARAGLVASVLLAAAGIAAAAIHGTLIAAGRPEFRAPASIAVLAASLAVSLAQAAVAAGGATSSGRTSP